jgi:(d)CTP diphosphatase
MKLEPGFTGMSAVADCDQVGAYALIRDADARVLLVQAESGRFYLPGGRVEAGETPPEALAREVEEECGWSARIGASMGERIQSILGGTIRLRATFWRAELVAEVQGAAEHRMIWATRRHAAACLHRLADAEALRLLG